ncbi:ABC transporter permease [Paenibacillus sp. GCM10027627]|uniref:ABC transporter permease n=1 Tax=unclassified Paenibacillus TaxID=185978 RepID=UPI0036453307
MLPFFRKDLLMYWRDRKEVMSVIMIPILLTVVLGYALPGWIEGTPSIDRMTVALVNEDDEAQSLERFRERLLSAGLTEAEQTALLGSAERLNTASELKQLLTDGKVKSWIDLREMDAGQALKELKDGEVTAIVTIPEHFSYSLYSSMFLKEKNDAQLELIAEKSTLQVDMISSLLDSFIRSMNIQQAIHHAWEEEGLPPPIGTANPLEEQPATDRLERPESATPLKSFQYYGISLCILSALFISGTVAMHSSIERRNRVIERIRLSGANPLGYLSSKAVAAFTIALIQLTSVLLICHLIFGMFPDRSAEFWLGLVAAITVYALLVASLAALFTSIMFRVSGDVFTGLMYLLLIGMGTVGGGFVPIYMLPEWMRAMGEWTPNGLSLSTLLQWLQYEQSSELMQSLTVLIGMGVCLLALAAISFPKRGRA